MEWGFDIGGGEVSQGFDRGGRVDGLRRGSTGDSIFSTRVIDRREKEGIGLEASFTGRVSNPSIGESSEHASHASSVVDVTAGTTRAGGRGAGRVGRSSARGVIAGRGARGEPRLRGVRSAPGLGRRPRMSARRLRVPWWCSATTRRRAGGEMFKRRAFALVPLARGWRARAIRGSRFGRASTIGARRARGPTRRCPRGGRGSAARAEV